MAAELREPEKYNYITDGRLLLAKIVRIYCGVYTQNYISGKRDFEIQYPSSTTGNYHTAQNEHDINGQVCQYTSE